MHATYLLFYDIRIFPLISFYVNLPVLVFWRNHLNYPIEIVLKYNDELLLLVFFDWR